MAAFSFQGFTRFLHQFVFRQPPGASAAKFKLAAEARRGDAAFDFTTVEFSMSPLTSALFVTASFCLSPVSLGHYYLHKLLFTGFWSVCMFTFAK